MLSSSYCSNELRKSGILFRDAPPPEKSSFRPPAFFIFVLAWRQSNSRNWFLHNTKTIDSNMREGRTCLVIWDDELCSRISSFDSNIFGCVDEVCDLLVKGALSNGAAASSCGSVHPLTPPPPPGLYKGLTLLSIPVDSQLSPEIFARGLLSSFVLWLDKDREGWGIVDGEFDGASDFLGKNWMCSFSEMFFLRESFQLVETIDFSKKKRREKKRI